MKLLSHTQPDKPLEEHLLNVANQSKKIVLSKNLDLDISTEVLAQISYLIGICHDFGKATTDFQHYLTGQGDFDPKRKNHGFISAIFGFFVLKAYCQKHNVPIKYAYLGAHAIKRHHGNLENILLLFRIDKTIGEDQILHEQFQNILCTENYQIFSKHLDTDTQQLIKDILPCIDNIERNHQKDLFLTVKGTGFADFFIQELLYSVLIDSDKKDAARILDPEDIPRGVTIPEDSVRRYLQEQRRKQPDKFNPEERRKAELVRLKNQFLECCTENENITADKRLYSITAPTGIGKTFTSLATALRLKTCIAEKTRQDYRIHYILPFTTIIDQNYKEFREVLLHTCRDFSEREHDYLMRHHYLAAPERNESDEGLKKEKYQSKSYLDDLLFIRSWDAKLVVSTYVQLMHTLVGGKNSMMNKFHNIINSIIILDEVQCIQLKHWELMRKAFETLSSRFGTYFIFLTATQPPIFNDDLSVTELSDERFMTEKLFNRVDIEDYTAQEQTTDELFQSFVKTEASQLKDRYILVMNTKRSAYEIYTRFLENKDKEFPEHEIIYLSTSITKHDRDRQLEQIKGHSPQLKRFILVTTQLIEAGVDISSDVCYRDIAPMDSIIQSAGRVNRFGELGDTRGVLRIVKIVQRDEEDREYLPYKIYNTTIIQWTIETLAETRPKESSDFSRTCKSFFSKGYSPEGQTKMHSEEIIEGIRKLNFTKVFEEFKVIDEYPTHTVFILTEESKKLIESYKTAFHTKYTNDTTFRSKWRGNLKRIRSQFSNHTIELTDKQFKHASTDNDIKELGAQFFYIDLTKMDKKERQQTYTSKTGYNLELTAEDGIVL